MKAKNGILVIAALLLWASIHLTAGQTTCCSDATGGGAARSTLGPTGLANVSFYKVPLVCPAAPHIGCGSASKPLLLELERSEAVSEAWLNRAGNVMAIVWREQAKPRQRTKAPRIIPKERGLKATELFGEPKQEATRDFQSREGWYRGADVDRLSEEEAGIIARRLIGRAREKIVVTDAKADILKEAFTDQLKRQLTGKCTREETKEELLKVARQNLDEKDVAVLLENFGQGFRPKNEE